MTDSQPALGPDGQLLDASKIDWYNDPDDAHPIQPTHPVRTTQSMRLAEAIAEEKLNEYGDLTQPPRHCPTKSRNLHRVSKRKRMPVVQLEVATKDVGTDVDDSDDNFAASTKSESDSG
jgi:hypothetical protein